MTSTLNEIALGQATPSQARAAIRSALEAGTAASWERVYTVLRAWVWKALDGRRRDAELGEWFDILRRTRAFLADKDPAQAERLHVLHDLIHESITASEVLSPAVVLSRAYVPEILAMLRSGPTDRAEIGNRLQLKQSNLSRILNMMSSARLIERTVYGRRAIFELTPFGSKAVAKLKPPKIPGPVPIPDRLDRENPSPWGKTTNLATLIAGLLERRMAEKPSVQDAGFDSFFHIPIEDLFSTPEQRQRKTQSHRDNVKQHANMAPEPPVETYENFMGLDYQGRVRGYVKIHTDPLPPLLVKSEPEKSIFEKVAPLVAAQQMRSRSADR